jgi:uncharacterized membrane protein YfcA
MARNTAEIQAEIAVTRDVIESRLDALQRRAPRPLWIALGLLGAGAVVGAALGRVPILRVLGVSARALQAGIGVVTAVAAIRHVLSGERRHSGDAHRVSRPDNRWHRAA